MRNGLVALAFLLPVMVGCDGSRSTRGPVVALWQLKGESDISDVFFVPNSTRYVIVETGRVLAFDTENSSSLESARLKNSLDNNYQFGAVSSQDGHIYVGRFEDGLERFDSKSFGAIDAPEVVGSHFYHSVQDSRHYITVLNNNTLARIDAETNEIVWTAKTRLNPIYCAHSFTSGLVALGEFADDGAGRVAVYDLTRGEPTGATIDHEESIRGIAFSQDGTLIVSTGDDGFLRVYDVARNEILWDQKNDVQGAFAVAVHPNNDYVAVGCMRGIKIWSLKTKRLVSSWNGHTWFVRCLAFSDDGQYLLSSAADKTAALWRTEDLIGRVRYTTPR